MTVNRFNFTVRTAAPTGLSSTATTSSSVSLSWNAVQYATGYRLYRGGALVASPTGTTATDSGLAASTSYSYTVSAVSAGGESVQSGAANATTQSASVVGFVDGTPYTITGNGFGSKTIAAPVMWDNITNSGYGTITNGATVPGGGSYPWETNNGGVVKFSTGTTRANSKPTYTATGVTAQLENDGRVRTKTGKAYVSWWFRPSSVPGGDHSSKFLRMSDSRSLTNQTFSWTQQQSIIYDTITASGYVANQWHSSGMTAGGWNFVEVWFDTSTRAYTIRVNNSPVVNGVNWSAPSTFDANVLWLIGWDGGGNSPPSITWHIDCVYHDNSLARVVLGNASTYAACTSFEMQPATSWSDTSITIEANKGARTGTAYLYVIGSSGALVNSNGYVVTI